MTIPQKDKKTPIKELGGNQSNEVATPGNYRACVILDSCVYYIGQDTPDRMLAFAYCQEYANDSQPVQIFDDKGERHIIEGKLKMGKDNSFLSNASSYFGKLMKETYISKSDILSLKKKLKVMKDNGMIEYNPILNKITNISNKATGKQTPELLQGVYEDFKLLG